MSPEALTNANSYTVALIHSLITKQNASEHDMAQIQLTVEQLPTQVVAEVIDLLEKQNNLITSKLTEHNNMISSTSLTPWNDWLGVHLLLHRLQLRLYAKLCHLPTDTRASKTTVLSG